MIPGKVFFQSINVSQQLSKRYQIHLLLNNIYYDKIKIFHTKYLCLTSNDLLQVELSIRQPIDHYNDQTHTLRDAKQHQNATQTKPQSYVKVVVPQAYKLLIESKTIQVKFMLNKKNRNQTIKVSLAFQPVLSFNRKKLLGVNILSARTINKNSNNQKNNRLAYFNNSSETNPNVFQFNEGDSLISNEQLFPQELNFNKKQQFSQLQSPVSTHSKAQTMKQQNFFNNIKHQQQRLSIPKQRVFSKQKHHQQYKGYNPQQQFSQTIKSQTFSDLFDKQVNTSRTYNIPGTRDNIKISQDSNEESHQGEYQTEGNYNSSQAPSQLDTLESLAYQRERILGELFGKFSHRNKK